MKITKDISIEELIEEIPASVKYLMNEGIRCIVCGEPIWGTLEEAVEEKGLSDNLDKYINDLQELSDKPHAKDTKQEKKIDVDKLN